MCSRIFWSDNRAAKVSSRTMDWAVSDEPELWVLPQGLDHDGGTGDRALRWTSRHGSVAVSAWGLGASEAVNERGLAAHLLYLEATEYEPADDRRTVSNTRWAQWIVDTCGSVAEAVAAAADVRCASVEVRGHEMGFHFALEDATGDSAIIELLDGRLDIRHGPEHTVVTNDPGYDEQLRNLARYNPFGGDLPLPGDILSPDRFVRARYFLHYLPEPASHEEAVAGAVLVSRNVWVPPGAPYEDLSVYPTWWASASDLTNRVFYFQTVTSPNLVWLELDDLDLAEGSPVLRLDPKQPGLVGDVVGSLCPAPALY